MRITLAGNISADISTQLSRKLKLPLIEPVVSTCPTTGLPSDDLTIHAMIEVVGNQMQRTDENGVFLLNNYPQNVTQAQSLDMAFAQIGQPVSCAVMMEATKKSTQNRENRALIRYYRTQNKLILFNETDSISEICSRIHHIYDKRRSSSG